MLAVLAPNYRLLTISDRIGQLEMWGSDVDYPPNEN